MKRLTLAFIVSCFLIHIQAQSNRDKAIEIKDQAIELMDNSEIEESLKLLEEAQKIDPDYINIPYEIAYAYQLAKEYDKSIEIAKPLLKHKEVFDQVFQIIGNCYDLKGDKNKAIKYYNKGLKKFPNSGKLYLEKGVVIASQEKWLEALEVWEQGIIADPAYSSNYFWASYVLTQTDEKIWGIYYGEMFINLEPNTPRTAQISKILYDTYKNCLPIKDNKWSLEFSLKATNIVIGSLKDLKFSFETVHNLAMEKGYQNVEPKFTLANLITIRKQFLNNWNDNYADRYPNLIFDYHNQLINHGVFDIYFYWLLKDGSVEEFENWKSSNEQTYADFLLWINENKMLFMDENKTNRFSYD